MYLSDIWSELWTHNKATHHMQEEKEINPPDSVKHSVGKEENPEPEFHIHIWLPLFFNLSFRIKMQTAP